MSTDEEALRELQEDVNRDIENAGPVPLGHGWDRPVSLAEVGRMIQTVEDLVVTMRAEALNDQD